MSHDIEERVRDIEKELIERRAIERMTEKREPDNLNIVKTLMDIIKLLIFAIVISLGVKGDKILDHFFN